MNIRHRRRRRLIFSLFSLLPLNCLCSRRMNDTQPVINEETQNVHTLTIVFSTSSKTSQENKQNRDQIYNPSRFILD